MAELAEAVGMALGRRPDPAFWAALAGNPAEARDLAYQDAARRREAALLGRGHQ